MASFGFLAVPSTCVYVCLSICLYIYFLIVCHFTTFAFILPTMWCIFVGWAYSTLLTSYKYEIRRLKCPKYTEIHVFSKIWCFYACIQFVPRKYQALYNCYYSQIWSIVILWFGAYFNALKPSQKGKYVQKMSILSIFLNSSLKLWSYFLDMNHFV